MALVEGLAGRFRGCMVGALMGDCFGAPFEADMKVSKSVLNNYFKRLQDPNLKVPYKVYTDDTAMARCVAQSLIDSKEYNAKDMARKFVKEYYSEPGRGYGANIANVFAALRANKFSDLYTPAGIQFDGRGSFGNGGAMRVAPVALFCFSKPFEEVASMAKDTALLTHGSRMGYNGAVLQCLAVHQALHTPAEKLDGVIFIESLIEKMKKIETPTDDDIFDEGEEPYLYVKRLENILEIMERGSSVSTDVVVEELGNHIAAHLSVPTAVYSFVRASNTIAEIETDSPIQRTIQYAISLGGDTDTIATMAGGIAGAYYGIEKVPHNLKRHCEAIKDAMQQADELFKLVDSTTNS